MQVDLQEARARYGKSRKECAAALGITEEGYRLKEVGTSRITGFDLARLADFYDVPLNEAFPNYEPSDEERALVRHLQNVA